jgi:hypothetical protein
MLERLSCDLGNGSRELDTSGRSADDYKSQPHTALNWIRDPLLPPRMRTEYCDGGAWLLRGSSNQVPIPATRYSRSTKLASRLRQSASRRENCPISSDNLLRIRVDIFHGTQKDRGILLLGYGRDRMRAENRCLTLICKHLQGPRLSVRWKYRVEKV